MPFPPQMICNQRDWSAGHNLQSPDYTEYELARLYWTLFSIPREWDPVPDYKGLMRERRKAPSLGDLRHNMVIFLRRSRKESKQCQGSMCLTPTFVYNWLRLLTGARKSPNPLPQRSILQHTHFHLEFAIRHMTSSSGPPLARRWLVDTAPHTQGLSVADLFTQSKEKGLFL